MSTSVFATGFYPDYPGPSQSVHGGVGLIQVPTARFAEAGQFSMNYYDNDFYRFWSVSLTLFPWMESTVRYTDIRNRLYSDDPGFSGDQTLKDKGIDVKFRLWEEQKWQPQIVMGLKDFGGTGYFESEFLAASKRVGNVDFHLGLGWGYLGRSGSVTNPFCQIWDAFCERPSGFSGLGGKIDYQRFFKGPAALYYGLEYQTPWAPLRLKIEKEGNDYRKDRAGIVISQESAWNAAANYRVGNFDFSLNYQRGNSVGFGVSYRINFHTVRHPRVDSPPREVTERAKTDSIDEVDGVRLIADLKQQAGFGVQQMKLTEETLTLIGKQDIYPDQDESIERIGRILVDELPRAISEIRIVDTQTHVPVVETRIDARAFIQAAGRLTLEPELTASYQRVAPDPDETRPPLPEKRLSFNLETFWKHSFGAPESFYMYQMGLIGSAEAVLTPEWSLLGSVKLTLLDNYDTFNFKVDAEENQLPRVRTYVREYVTRSDATLETLYGRWQTQLTENWYALGYAGYLETMFAGAGGELLYRPVDSHWAVGLDINRVRQRDYEEEFGWLAYQVTTGHLTVYWEPDGMPDLLLMTGVGQFLAGDRGVHLEVAKRFESGIVTGAYAAFTNVSAEEFGEGSFNKGFYIVIPFDLFTPRPAKGRGVFPWVPLAKDGGQKLARPSTLFGTTSLRSRFGG
jgi:hypothetical protein